MSKILIGLGFIVFPFDEGIFIHIELCIIIACHVDDFLFMAARKSDAQKIEVEISKQIKLQDMGEVFIFLGNEIIIDDKNQSIFIYQTKYTMKILKDFGKDKVHPVENPWQAGVKLRKNKNQAS